MTWWQYLILANLYLALFYGFYALLLRKETFFQLNRVYLVSSAVLSFLIPAMQANWVQNLFITQQVKQVIYNGPVMLYQYQLVEETGISIGQILGIVYIAGITILAMRFIWQLMLLRRMIHQPENSVAYAFFNKINVDGNLAENEVISAHEEVHARQWHSADVMIMELIMIINWFNPVVYLYRNAIKHIHEFIADMQVIKAGADKAGYAMLLLNQTLNTASHQLVNPFFNHSFLKKRIIMLQKNRSQRIKLVKYGLSAPLFAMMIILSSATMNDNTAVAAINKKAGEVMATKANEALTINLNEVKSTFTEVVAPKIEKAVVIKQTAVDTIPQNNTEVFTEVERNPEFPGGIPAFSKFLGTNIRYPSEARDKNVQGRVFVSFIVEKDGTLSDFKIERGIGSGADEEAIRVLALSPKWKPGVQNGRPVRVKYNVPIQFSLAGDNKNDAPKVGMAKSLGSGVTVTSYKNANMADTTMILGHTDGKNIVYKIDGREVTMADFKGLDNSRIKSINVIKNAEAKAGDKGKDGIIEVITKDSGSAFSTFSIQGDNNKPAYVLNGKELSAKQMTKIDPKDIESLNVLKGEAATAKYGDKGAFKNGVVEITLKKK